PLGEADKGLLDRAAKHFVYRLTQPKYQFHQFGATEARGVNDLVHEAIQQIAIPDPKKSPNQFQNQQVYIREFGTRLVAAIQEVLKGGKPIARVNVARILAKLGETSQEALAKPMCDILEDKDQLDAVKFYVLMGLKNVFKSNPEGIKDEDLKVRTIEVL